MYSVIVNWYLFKVHFFNWFLLVYRNVTSFCNFSFHPFFFFVFNVSKCWVSPGVFLEQMDSPSGWVLLIHNLAQWFSIEGNLVSQKIFGNSWGHFLVVTLRGGVLWHLVSRGSDYFSNFYTPLLAYCPLPTTVLFGIIYKFSSFCLEFPHDPTFCCLLLMILQMSCYPPGSNYRPLAIIL